MSTSSKALIAAVIGLLIFSIALGHSDGIYNPGGRGVGLFEGPINGGSPIPQPTGKILAVDGVSFILQTDGVSKICRAGGC